MHILHSIEGQFGREGVVGQVDVLRRHGCVHRMRFGGARRRLWKAVVFLVVIRDDLDQSIECRRLVLVVLAPLWMCLFGSQESCCIRLSHVESCSSSPNWACVMRLCAPRPEWVHLIGTSKIDAISSLF